MTSAERAAASDKAELSTARSEQRATRRKTIWVALVVFVCIVVANAATLQYVAHVNKKNDARWCALLTTLDSAYTANTPTTPVGREVAKAVHNLRIQLECTGGGVKGG